VERVEVEVGMDFPYRCEFGPSDKKIFFDLRKKIMTYWLKECHASRKRLNIG
jgi:hypothetical protein